MVASCKKRMYTVYFRCFFYIICWYETISKDNSWISGKQFHKGEHIEKEKIEQLPNINVEFVVGNNDLDFYKFLKENGGLPDIITCCCFSLHDASPLKNSLMDLSTTNVAGAVYDTYLNNFMNEDGSVNWFRDRYQMI